MKVLCPIDFSKTSVNACKWISAFVNEFGGGEVHILHCINVRSRSAMFKKVDDIFSERAEDDLKQLTLELSTQYDNVSITSSVVIHDPKSYIPSHAEKHNYDFVVTGTKGLTALKDITVGSVTEYIIRKCNVPVLTIPNNCVFQDISAIVVGVDDRLISNEGIVKPLIEICKETKSKLHMVHVRRRGDSMFEYDPGLDLYFRDLNYEYASLEYDDSVAETISEYCEKVDAGIMCMIHRKRNWFEGLFHSSVTKSELFEVEIPLLVLHANQV